MIVLDASVLIAYLESGDDHHTRAEAMLSREIDDDFGVNSLTLAEVLVAPARTNQLAAVTVALNELGVRELPFPADAAFKLAELRAGTNLRMPDCCVLLAAEEATARLASFDNRLATVAEGRNVITVRD